MVVKKLHITGPQNEAAEVVLGTGDQAYSIGTTTDGTFAISHAGTKKPFLSTDAEGNLYARAEYLVSGGFASTGNLLVGNVEQWALVDSAEFSKGAQGWDAACLKGLGDAPATLRVNDQNTTCIKAQAGGDNMGITACGGVRMLGGFRKFSAGYAMKTFTGLPASHSEVRIQGTAHFIDHWEGDTLFMKVPVQQKAPKSGAAPAAPLEYVWTHSYDARESSRAPSVCGTEIPEGRFAVPFDVTIAHSGPSLTVLFGSTLLPKYVGTFDKSVEAFWGISAFNVYVRGTQDMPVQQQGGD